MNINIIAGAVLDASGRSDGTLTLGGSQTLLGNGTMNGSLVVSSNSTVAPGASVGSLAINGPVTFKSGGNLITEGHQCQRSGRHGLGFAQRHRWH